MKFLACHRRTNADRPEPLHRDRFKRMRAVWTILVALIISAPFATPSLADAAHDGSWTKSCSDRVVDDVNHVVKGYCGQGNGSVFHTAGKRHTTLIRTDLCSGDIWNDHGHIKCDRYPANAWSVPDSAAKTCMNSFVADNQYTAKCRRKGGDQWNWTSIPKQTCNSALNLDGTLTCSPNYVQWCNGNCPPPPPASQTYTLCYIHYGFKQTVASQGVSPDDAINKFRATLPNDGIGDLVTLGACI